MEETFYLAGERTLRVGAIKSSAPSLGTTWQHWILAPGPDGDFATFQNKDAAHCVLRYYRRDAAGPGTLRGEWIRAAVAAGDDHAPDLLG